MKKLIALIVCAMFVFGLAAYAMADVTISGDARVRGAYKKNFDFDDDVADHKRFWDQRFRVKIDTNVDNVKAHMRFTVSEGTWGTGATYTDKMVMDDDDYAYLEIPIGAFTIYAGRQHADWGHKFLVWNAGVDRFKVNYKISDAAKTGLFTTKKTEKNDPMMHGDTDDYGFYFIQSSDAFTGGLLLVHNVQNVESAPSKDGEAADFFFTAKTSAATIVGELAWKNGVLTEETPRGNSMYGGFVMGMFGSDSVKMHAAVAHARDGYVANKYFNPTLFIGTSQLTAIIDFNQNIGLSTDGTDTVAALFGAEFPLADALTGGARAAYMVVHAGDENVDAPDETKDVKFVEVDLWANYKLAETTNWIFEFGYLDPSQSGTTLDEAMVFVQRIEHRFQ